MFASAGAESRSATVSSDAHTSTSARCGVDDGFPLRDVLQRDDGEMLPRRAIHDTELDLDTGPTSHERLRPSARRPSRPSSAWLEASDRHAPQLHVLQVLASREALTLHADAKVGESIADCL